jgi:hypothetical protein
MRPIESRSSTDLVESLNTGEDGGISFDVALHDRGEMEIRLYMYVSF